MQPTKHDEATAEALRTLTHMRDDYDPASGPHSALRAQALDLAIRTIQTLTDKTVDPDRCSQEIFDKGVTIGLFDIPKEVANSLCDWIYRATGARVDWHYVGGRVHMKGLPPAGDKHHDDMSIDAFAATMKAKMAKKRDEGLTGWWECDAEYLSDVLRELVAKGDPVDVANLAMMLHCNDQTIVALPVPEGLGEWVTRLRAADKPLMQQTRYSEVRALLRETADMLANTQTGGPLNVPYPNGRAPTGEQLYMMVTAHFEGGHFPWSMVMDSGKRGWEAAAADLVFAPDTIMARYGADTEVKDD